MISFSIWFGNFFRTLWLWKQALTTNKTASLALVWFLYKNICKIEPYKMMVSLSVSPILITQNEGCHSICSEDIWKFLLVVFYSWFKEVRWKLDCQSCHSVIGLYNYMIKSFELLYLPCSYMAEFADATTDTQRTRYTLLLASNWRG